MEIYIIRHGETDYNKQHIIQGSGIDSDLNETGINQGLAFFEKYKSENFSTVLTSKLKRTHQTVEPFLKSAVIWEQHSTINEISWGIEEGKKPNPKSRNEYRKIRMAWESDDLNAKITGGESAHELGVRVAEFVEELKTRTEEKILVCCHGRTLRALICLMKGEPLQNMNNYKHQNTCLYKAIRKNNTFVFELENDVSHLD